MSAKTPSAFTATAQSIHFDVKELLTSKRKSLSCLGQGAYGSVYKCYEKRYHVVAVKCIKATNLGSVADDVKQNAEREAEIVMRANHANVVRLYGLVRFDDTIGLVMEYMPEGSLYTILNTKSIHLSWSFRLRVAYEIISGLSFLHALEEETPIVHGDLKPGNILLDSDFHAKLADFGSSTIASVTTTNRFYLQAQGYTDAYCAPEVMKSPFYVPKPSSDIFSFAMTLYHVIFRVPSLSRKTENLKSALESGERPSLENLTKIKENENETNVGFIDILVNIMEGCWVTKPEQRMEGMEVRKILVKANDKISPIDIAQTIAAIKKSKNRKSESGEEESNCVPLSYHFGEADKRARIRSSKASTSGLNSGNRMIGPSPLTPQENLSQWVEFEDRIEDLRLLFDSGKKEEYFKQMSELGKFVSETQDRGLYIYKLAIKLLGEGNGLSAMMVFQNVSKAYLFAKNIPNEIIDLIQSCVAKNMQIAINLAQAGDNSNTSLVADFVVPGMESVIDDLCAMKYANRRHRAVQIGWCYKYVGDVYNVLQMYQKAVSSLFSGVSILEREIQKQEVSAYKIYGYLYYCMGVGLHKLNRNADALNLFLKAQEAMEEAKDWRNNDERSNAFKENTSGYNKSQKIIAVESKSKSGCKIM